MVFQQYKANLGKRARVSQASSVTNQYGLTGAIGNFAEVFDSPEDPSDSQLRIYNIMTSIDGYAMPDIADAHLALLGKLSYGIGSASFEADFDWKIGTQISVAASFVRISVAFSEVGELAPAEVAVQAMLSSGSRASRSQVTRSYPQLLVHDDNPVIFPIPPLAHALNLFSDDPDFYAVDGVQIRFIGAVSNGFSATSTGLASWVHDAAPFELALANEDGVRFPESAKYVEISTDDEEAEFFVTPCFTLSL